MDEDVDVLLAELVRRRGFEVTTTQDASQIGKSDAEQLKYAVYHKKTLMTHNRADFEKLAQNYFQIGRAHCGIIIAVRRTPYELARRLLGILNHVTPREMERACPELS
ncbi:MAG: DUF5615 family PIN-like protein [bacterium]